LDIYANNGEISHRPTNGKTVLQSTKNYEAIKQVNKICLLKKKELNTQRKTRRRRKRKKNEEEAEQHTTEIKRIKKKTKVATMSTQENQVADFSKNIHDIMNGVKTTEGSPNNDEDEWSPVKKQGGSSKSSTKRGKSH
jgi:hypothetical protein